MSASRWFMLNNVQAFLGPKLLIAIRAEQGHAGAGTAGSSSLLQESSRIEAAIAEGPGEVRSLWIPPNTWGTCCSCGCLLGGLMLDSKPVGI